MSAFVVNDLTIKAIVGYLAEASRESSALASNYAIRESLAKAGYILNSKHRTDVKACQKLTDDLIAMNYASVNGRYKDSKKPHTFIYEHNAAYYTRGQAAPRIIKTMQCYLYQSCEEECDQRDLYKLISALRKEIAIRHIACQAGYDSLPWGEDEEPNRVISLMDMRR